MRNFGVENEGYYEAMYTKEELKEAKTIMFWVGVIAGFIGCLIFEGIILFGGAGLIIHFD